MSEQDMERVVVAIEYGVMVSIGTVASALNKIYGGDCLGEKEMKAMHDIMSADLRRDLGKLLRGEALR